MAFTGMADDILQMTLDLVSSNLCNTLNIRLKSVEIKHAGKQHKVEFNPVGDAKAFKESIYQVTGVPTGKFRSIPTRTALLPGL